ncbi:hypothetical protein GCM10008955_40840 [Deinococcus malanensis]|uniref:Uncharacterized protein n=1 Tax=Deinococcus malanensis TaxID=1706855 RepID=A0ABQ2F5U9_9DEIO|nr:hypothetical protein [Deinococcus malanensis]GGK42876.1 hypothetical protein GCM10008955_40840 [Deinococcus malanensis]
MTLTAVREKAPEAERIETNKCSDTISAQVGVSQWSSKYPHLEYRLISAKNTPTSAFKAG